MGMPHEGFSEFFRGDLREMDAWAQIRGAGMVSPDHAMGIMGPIGPGGPTHDQVQAVLFTNQMMMDQYGRTASLPSDHVAHTIVTHSYYRPGSISPPAAQEQPRMTDRVPRLDLTDPEVRERYIRRKRRELEEWRTTLVRELERREGLASFPDPEPEVTELFVGGSTESLRAMLLRAEDRLNHPLLRDWLLIAELARTELDSSPAPEAQRIEPSAWRTPSYKVSPPLTRSNQPGGPSDMLKGLAMLVFFITAVPSVLTVAVGKPAIGWIIVCALSGLFLITQALVRSSG